MRWIFHLLNLDLHQAVVEARCRHLTVADVAKGIDLSTLALDFSSVHFPTGESIDPEQIEAFVNSYFDVVDAANVSDDTESQKALSTPLESIADGIQETSFDDPSEMDSNPSFGHDQINTELSEPKQESQPETHFINLGLLDK